MSLLDWQNHYDSVGHHNETCGRHNKRPLAISDALTL